MTGIEVARKEIPLRRVASISAASRCCCSAASRLAVANARPSTAFFLRAFSSATRFECSILLARTRSAASLSAAIRLCSVSASAFFKAAFACASANKILACLRASSALALASCCSRSARSSAAMRASSALASASCCSRSARSSAAMRASSYNQS